MKTITGIAPAGARSSVTPMRQERFAQNKWKLLQAVEDARLPLELKGTSIAILRAMLSFIKADQITVATDDGHICFASNVAIAKRSHVSVQTVERHIAKLVSLGLLNRRSSGNGKRWARRDRQGNVTFATGLSLLPMVQRHAEFLQIGQRYDDLKREISLLRDKCASAIAALKEAVADTNNAVAFLAKARNVMRRRADKAALSQLLLEITAEISRIEPHSSNKLMDTAHEIEGHKDTYMNPSVKEKEINKIEVSSAQMEHSFPKLCSELRTARNHNECNRIMDDLAIQLALGKTWFEIKKLGPTISFMLLGYLLERIEGISNPRGYTMTLLSGLQRKTLNWQSLLTNRKLAFNAP